MSAGERAASERRTKDSVGLFVGVSRAQRMSLVNELILPLNISPEEMLAYYRGEVANVFAVSEDGRSVVFPAHVLRPFMTHTGIVGRFRLVYDDHGRYRFIERLSA